MTMPPDPNQPGYPAQPGYPPQPGYPAQPGYPQPAAGAPYGAPAPGAYPPPYAGVPMAPIGMPASSARPGMVTAAAVLSFIWGGLAILGALVSMLVGGVASTVGSACNVAGVTSADCDTVKSAGGFLIFVSIVLIIVAALLIWGGVVALSGKNTQICVIAAGILIILEIVEIIAAGSVAFAIFGIIVPILIAVFLLNNASKAWVRSRGGKTF